ncbi:MAG: tRNA(adenine34) deaminase [Candidatus Midichloriaceae bacterium]|jgi:tRNA(adenine34) deaminase
MSLALEEAQKAFELDEVPVGAVITKGNEVISKSHNFVEKFKNSTSHAEINCIIGASKKLDSKFLNECDIYITLEPCAMCAQAISFARIKRIYYGASDEKMGAIEHGARLFNVKNAIYVPEIYGDILSDKSEFLLKTFFKNKRVEKIKDLRLS